MSANIILSTITIVFSGIFLAFALAMEVSDSVKEIGPRTWPTTILILMLILGVILLIRTVLENKKHDRSIENKLNRAGTEVGTVYEEGIQDEPYKETLSNKHFFVAAILFLYVFMIPILGFLITTLLLMSTLSWFLGMKRRINIAITAIVSSISFIYLFTTLLLLPLPRGVWIFREFSLLFY